MMKIFKRIICFLLLFVSIGVFSACSPKGDSGSSGGGNDLSQNDNNSGGDETQEEVYVAYTSSEILALGSEFVGEFFEEFEIDTTDEELFDDNISEMKILFLNASKMIKKISEMTNLPYGYCVNGQALNAEEYSGKPNQVARFYAIFSDEDDNGNASVRLRFGFSYDGLDVSLDYDYYDILISE